MNNCSEDWYNELNENKICTLYKKDQLIFSEGEPVHGIFFVKQGKVKVFKESSYRNQIIRFASDGDILGHRGMGGDNKYPISASIMEDSLICYIDQGSLFKLLENNPSLAIKMMLFYAEELKKTEIRFRNMAVMTVRERVAEALLIAQKSFNSEGDRTSNIELSRKEIAEIAGTYADQVSRYLGEFRNEKLIELNGHSIILNNPEKLQQLINVYDIDTLA